jgi:hypothetical protein
MNALIRAFGLLGLAIGIAAAAAWHWWRSSFSGGFIAYSPPGSFTLPMHHPGWWPTLVLFPLLGLVIGVVIAAILTRLGWALSRAGR